MATTSNYSFPTPDDTDLVKDGASAIRSFGTAVDTQIKALSPGTTAGDVDYYTTSTAKARLAIGTAGQVLQVNSGATAPEWANPVYPYNNYQTFTSSGTFTVPAGITKLAVYAVGGGAGGGSGEIKVTASGCQAGGGGSGGAIASDPFYTVTPAANITVTVGAGGAGGAAVTSVSTATSGLVGAAGTNSSFDSNTISSGIAGAAYNLGGVNTNQAVSSLLINRIGSNGAAPGNSTTFNTVKNLLDEEGSLGTNGAAASAGTVLGTAGVSTNAGFGGGGGGGQGLTNSTTFNTAGVGTGGGGSGGAAAYSSTNITTTAGAGGAGAVNRGAGGAGGGGCYKVGTTTTSVTSGAGGNGGSGVVIIFY